MHQILKRSFEIPDLSGRLPLFDSTATIGTSTIGAAPNIKGQLLHDYGRPIHSGTGPFYQIGGRPELRGSTGSGNTGTGFDASRCSAVYSDSATGIIPAGVYMNWIIKAF